MAERYLREHRGIGGELPGNLRFCRSLWHREAEQSFPSLIVGAFWPDGALARVQAIYLDSTTGAKASLPPGCKVKKTYGAGASHIPAVFRGAPGGRFDVLLTEGPEDATALRSVLGTSDIAAALGKGNLEKPVIAAGTRVCVVADNDADGKGLQTAQKAAAEHATRGCEAWIAIPPDGVKDANQLLIERGPVAVRAMIAEAEPYYAPAPPDALPPRLDAAEAQRRVNAAVAQAFTEALAWKRMRAWTHLDLNEDSGKPAPPVWAIKATLGLGKSQAVLERLADPALAGLSINYFAPEHRLNDELLERYNALAGPGSPEARVVRGYQQKLPSGEPVCRKADLAAAVGGAWATGAGAPLRAEGQERGRAGTLPVLRHVPPAAPGSGQAARHPVHVSRAPIH